MPKRNTTIDTDATVQLYEEQAYVEKRAVELGRVLVETKTETTDHVVEAMLRHEDVQVERVPKGVVVDQVPAVREEDGVLIIPVIEEQLVVQTRLVLKEELRVTRTSGEQLVRQVVPLRSETATVTRLPSASTPPSIKGDDQ